MQTLKYFYGSTKLIILISIILIFSCEKYDYRKSYSDCAESLKVRFELNEDWYYSHCGAQFMCLYNPKINCSIDVSKFQNPEPADSSYWQYIRDNYFFIRNDTTYTKYTGNIWQFYDGYRKHRVFETYMYGYQYTFSFISEDTNSFNNNVNQFNAFLSSLKID